MALAPRWRVRCFSPADVAAAVRFARGYGKACAATLRVRCLGRDHSWSRYGECPRGMRLDVNRLDRVLTVDRRLLRARVQAGCSLRALCAALAAHGLALPSLPALLDQVSDGRTTAVGTHSP